MTIDLSRVIDRSAGSRVRELRENGYVVLPELVPCRTISTIGDHVLDRLELTPFCQGLFNGSRTKRFHGLLKRVPGAEQLVLHPQILRLAEEILLPHCDALQLNLTQAVEIHPGEVAQVPHRDEEMWPSRTRSVEYMLNVMWPLSPYAPENGSTRLWAKSNVDRAITTDTDYVAPSLMPGAAVVFLGSTLHGAGANRTMVARRGVLVSYCLGWLRTYENMALTYPPEVARSFSRPLQQLIGYSQHRPNLGSYDGNCPSVLLDGQDAGHLPTRDCLLPSQERALAERSLAHQVSA
jgi:ectoine hydroxylase-related dioxygenase (phytanoyl-CoA dioxygenase family)